MEYKNNNKHYKEYKQLNINNTYYELGNNVLVKNNNENGINDYIGKIKMIILIITKK